MTSIGLALESRLRPGTCTAVPDLAGRFESRPATVEPARGGPKDYCLFDERGKHLGTIVAPRITPVLGASAPTLYLRNRGTETGAPQNAPAAERKHKRYENIVIAVIITMAISSFVFGAVP